MPWTRRGWAPAAVARSSSWRRSERHGEEQAVETRRELITVSKFKKHRWQIWLKFWIWCTIEGGYWESFHTWRFSSTQLPFCLASIFLPSFSLTRCRKLSLLFECFTCSIRTLILLARILPLWETKVRVRIKTHDSKQNDRVGFYALSTSALLCCFLSATPGQTGVRLGCLRMKYFSPREWPLRT